MDILCVHSCYSPQMATCEPLMNALVKVKKQGKARFIGVSTHNNEPDVIRASVEAGAAHHARLPAQTGLTSAPA